MRNALTDIDTSKVVEKKDSACPVQDIVYEYTMDENLLDQYYKLREDCYRKDLNLKEFSGAKDYYDEVSQILIARIGDKVIGGARLIISTPENRIRLCLEEENFIMEKVFPEFHLKHKSYCEFSRFVVDHDYRHGDVCHEILRLLIERASNFGCVYQFSVSELLSSRKFKIICSDLGIVYKICRDIKVPHKKIYENLNSRGMYLSVIYLPRSNADILLSKDKQHLFLKK